MTTQTTSAGAGTTRTGVAAHPAPKDSGGGGGILNVFSQGFLLLWAALVVLPLAWAVLSAFKDDKEIISSPFSLPSKLRWGNFSRAWVAGHIGDYFFVAGLTFPVFLGLTPLFLTMHTLTASGIPMLNTYHGLILVYVAFSLPFTVFFLH